MPYTAKQNRVFRAIEHGWDPPGNKFKGLSAEEAGKLADEGVADSVHKARRKHVISRKMRRGEGY